MTIEEIILWISSKNVKHFQHMQDNITNDEQWNRAKGAYDTLDELLDYIMLSRKNKENK